MESLGNGNAYIFLRGCLGTLSLFVGRWGGCNELSMHATRLTCALSLGWIRFLYISTIDVCFCATCSFWLSLQAIVKIINCQIHTYKEIINYTNYSHKSIWYFNIDLHRLFELSLKASKEGQNHPFDPSFEKTFYEEICNSLCIKISRFLKLGEIFGISSFSLSNFERIKI